MDKEAIKEKLIYYNGFKNNLWTAFIVLTGGLATLYTNLNNGYKVRLFYIGFFTAIIVIFVMGICIKKISMYIDALNKGD